MMACSREFDEDYDQPILTLADLNRYHRQKFGQRSMRDRHTKIATLRDLNERHHAQWGQS